MIPYERHPVEVKFSLEELTLIVKAIGIAQGAFEAITITTHMTDYQKDGVHYVMKHLREVGDMVCERLRYQ